MSDLPSYRPRIVSSLNVDNDYMHVDRCFHDKHCPFIYTMNRKSLVRGKVGIGNRSVFQGPARLLHMSLRRGGQVSFYHSRSEAVLDEMARYIRERFEVEFEVLSLDLADLDAPDRLFCKIDEMNRTVQILINNVGFKSYGRLQENPVERHGSQILL